MLLVLLFRLLLFFRLDKKNALVRKPAHSNILLSTIYREIHIAKLFLVRDTKVEQNNEIDKKILCRFFF